MQQVSSNCVVSIVMPTYNRASLIHEAIQSVLAQDYLDWELIIVDDGSIDNTRTVVEQFLVDKRVRYVYQENRGQAAARNRALSMASGRNIAFLDSDNRWKCHKLTAQMSYLERMPQAGLVYGENELIDEAGRAVPSMRVPRWSGRILEHLLLDNCVTFNTVVVRAECLSGMHFDESFRGGEDYDLLLRLAVNTEFHFLDQVLCEYRIAGDRVSDRTLDVLSANERSLRRIFDRHPVARSLRKRAIGRVRARMAVAHRRSGRWAKAIGLALEGCVLRPTDYGAWRMLTKVVINR